MQLNDRIFTGTALALIAGLLAISGKLASFDNLYYDLGRYLNFKPAPDNIVIVAIDEASLNDIGRWPWSRKVHSELVNKLSAEKARVIGLDVVFTELDRSAPEADQLLAKAIAQAGNVVLPILLKVPYIGSSITQTFPLPNFAAQAAALGRIHSPIDSDGIARGVYLWESLSVDGLTTVGFPHFARSVLQVANLLPANISPPPPTIKVVEPAALGRGGFASGKLVSHDLRKIKFLGYSEHFQHISYSKVLLGQYPPSFFKDKIVLVGTTAADIGDAWFTPVSAALHPMPAVEFHANTIATMLDVRLVADAPLWITGMLSVLLAIVPLLWFSRLSQIKSLLAVVIYFFIVMLLAVFAAYRFSFWIPPSGALASILLVYPIWSWRRLDSAQASLDKELQKVRDELVSLGMEQDDAGIHANEDPLQSRISNVKLTASYLRDLHKGRSDTLVFISHDIRAPLGAAMMLLDKFENNKYSERMRRLLGRAHAMAEGFLQASRAEMANVNKFKQLDMVSLTQQAVDDIYEISMAKQISLVMDFPEDSLWIRGDFGLLMRAVSNILLNAVNYSPENAVVKVLLHREDQSLSLKVVDQGPGIPAKKVLKLFRRFSRIEGEHQSQDGSGLGLYFVDVTIKKHRGSVSVQSEQGKGAMFIISLPLERRKNNKPVENDRRAVFLPTFSDTII